jgi:orotidine-5'-phosphate decarboxylase
VEDSAGKSILENVNARDRLIVALDLPTVREAKELVLSLSGLVSFFKLGLELQFDAGRSFIEWLRNRGCRVFLDLKFFDVEETVRRAVAQVANIGADFLTVHGNKSIIKAALEGRGKSDLKILAVTVLTNMNSEDMDDFGMACSVSDLVSRRANMAMALGCDGVIASGMEVEAILKQAKACPKIKAPFLLVVPGIRLRNSETHEHKRSVTPGYAISAGADYLVVGRPIRDAENKNAAAKLILEEMQTVFDTRWQSRSVS